MFFFVTFFIIIRYNIVRTEKTMDNQELALIKACQSGDAQSFGQLYEKYFKKIYSFVYYRVSHKETTEDLVSLVFTKALENISKFHKGYFSAWLYQIARNTVIDHYRTSKATQDLDSTVELHIDNQISELMDNSIELQEIKEKLDKLNEIQRDIIIMRVWDGLSYKEIAQIVGKSESNCKMIFSRGLKELRLSMSSLALLITLLID